MEEVKKDLFKSGGEISVGKFSENFHEDWVEESFYFEKAYGKQKKFSNYTREYLGNSFTARRLFFLFLSVFIIFFFIFLRLFYLQIIQGADNRVLAENNRQRIVPIPAERGLIYDRNGLSLTKNIPNFSLAIIPQSLPRSVELRENIISKLSSLTGISVGEIRALLEEYKDYTYESIVIKENLEYDTALSILIALGDDLPGIQIQRGSKRLYLNIQTEEITTSTPNSLSHVVGYIGKLNKDELKNLYSEGYYPSDLIGKTGIEKSYETFLRGTYGRKRIEVDAAGREQTVLAEEAPVPGFYLELSIDKIIQNKLEEIILSYLKNSNLRRVSAIVLDPNNGQVLALVSLPTFDNNDFSGGIKKEIYNNYLNDPDQPLFSRAYSGIFPSGSTIKPAIAAAAMEERIINAKTVFLSTGGLQVGQWFFPDWQAGGHGSTDVRRALAWSVNTFFYYIGGGYNNFTGLGVEKITEYLKKFGFGKILGLDLPGEEKGFLPSKEWKERVKNERWYVGDTYNLSIGQGDLLVTPLQVAAMTTVFANGGTLYKPEIIKAVIDPITKEEQPVESSILNENFINPDNIKTIRMGMKDCVDYGSCRRLSLLPISVAGKTGTAQWNSKKPNHAWFTSFAPFENPEITLTILVEEGGEGSATAAPIAYDFYKWWSFYRNIQE